MEKATFQDLIAKKMQREEDKYKFIEIEVPSIEKSLVFKKPSDELMLDVMDEIEKGRSTKAVAEASKRLIYLTCEALQSPELHKELVVADPFDTVSAIFDIAEVMTIGEKLFDFSGIGGLTEEIKKQ